MGMNRRGRRAVAIFTAAVVLTGSLFTASSASAAPPLPVKMAALGDSISQAAMTCSSLLSCPPNGWSTGTTASVNSHFTRLRTAGATSLVAYNNAVSGALSGGLNAQAAKAVNQGAQYVTVQIGANDACTRTVATMTPTATFKANVAAALTTLSASAAAPEIFLSSIPNIKLMYDINKSSTSARLAWGLLRICQSMLANPTSTKAADVQRRDAVQARVTEYNTALAEVCAATAKCKWDGGAVANYAFVKADISTRDYFHPSATGQAVLSSITWNASQWAS
ncbi:GDSL-type esterase/lipase family protein [Microbacterium lacus]|uniref:SGNH/GDSL hydrolase family protein n=1 Tax=Microbacterium lacus TaxID=415217 RepID=UPI00384F07D1